MHLEAKQASYVRSEQKTIKFWVAQVGLISAVSEIVQSYESFTVRVTIYSWAESTRQPVSLLKDLRLEKVN